jgi:hypothetical protein
MQFITYHAADFVYKVDGRNRLIMYFLCGKFGDFPQATLAQNETPFKGSTIFLLKKRDNLARKFGLSCCQALVTFSLLSAASTIICTKHQLSETVMLFFESKTDLCMPEEASAKAI